MNTSSLLYCLQRGINPINSSIHSYHTGFIYNLFAKNLLYYQTRAVVSYNTHEYEYEYMQSYPHYDHYF